MNGVERILVVEDDEGMRLSCRQALEQVGYEVVEAGSVPEAEPLLLRDVFDLVITDLRMPHGGGQEMLRIVKQVSPEVPVVLITAYPSVESAIEAFRGGVTDYLLKPFTSEQLIETVDNAAATRRASERAAIQRRIGENLEVPEIVGGSAKIRGMLAEVRRVAALDASVLVLGETGSGKELVSRAVHRFSRRSAGPFTVLNCAAIPENLFEAELFGYERGAFTGALTSKRGLMEEAHQGSLFLDEVAELPAPAQAKLLRCLEEKVVRRLGSVTARSVDTRIIAATHRDLRAEVEAGRFREDLYYRLAVLEIRVPPLRERPEDIAPLAIRILDGLRKGNDRPVVGFGDDALARLSEQAWPGNVRELQNVLQRAYARAEGSLIRAADLPLTEPARSAAVLAGHGRDRALSEFEKSYVTEALARNAGNVTHTAKELGVHRTTLQRMMKKLAIVGD